MLSIRPCLFLFATACAMPAIAQEKMLNLYSARHYQTDEALYTNFTRQTGIRINRIEGRKTNCSNASGTKAPTVRRTFS